MYKLIRVVNNCSTSHNDKEISNIGCGSQEYIQYKDQIYTRTNHPGCNYHNRFFYLNQSPGNNNETKTPHVVCMCGGESFILIYDEYSLRAICTQCNTEDSVYNG